MSVLSRLRGTSEMEFLNTAHELEMFTIRACHNENVIPKRYRLTKGNELMESARTIHKNITYANSIFPTKKKEYELRRNYQKRAMIEIQNMLALMRIVSELFPIKDSTLEEWVGLVLKEESALKNWISSDAKRYKDLP
jgi:hypothetical protein